MPVLKWKNKKGEWVPLYVNDIKNRLRKDKNLSDLDDLNEARENLGINSIEREVGNIALKLSEENIYPDYNTLVVEDFKDGETETDRTVAAVTNLAAGDNVADVSDVSQLRAGCSYTLADDELSEEVKIKSIIKTDKTNRVVFEQNTQNMYGGLPKLYRSTAIVRNDHVEGTGADKIFSLSTDEVWHGIHGSTENAVPFSTTIQNKDAFSVEGDIKFTENGEITLE